MTQDIYQQLAQHLDNLPAGYPATESGVELRILQRLFKPAEAELATSPRVQCRRGRLRVQGRSHECPR